MSGLSKLLLGRTATKSLLFGGKTTVNTVAQTCLVQPVRASHGRTMFIRPGKFYTKKYFDILHFHFVLAGLPFALFIAYQNFLVGPAKLTEIAEDFEPRHWEYHKHPIKRFLAKYVYDSPEQAYENQLDYLYTLQCKQKMKALETKVRNLMMERRDYKGWYYVPVPKESFELKEKFNKETLPKGYDPKYTK